MNTRAGTLPDVSEEVLAAGVVCLTGGRDVAKNPILTFPASTHSHLETWNSDRLERLLRCYVGWLSVTSQVRSVACVADMQQASKCVITVIVDALEKLELNSRGTVSAVYFLKPQNKARSKLLKKLLGMKPSKKHPKIPLFKVLLLKTYQELFSQIDLSQLTSDVGGTLHYDHMAWTKLYEMVAPCIRRVDTVLRKMPDMRDRVELLQDYEAEGCSVADLQSLLIQLTESYQQTVHEAHFRDILDRCKQILLLLDSVDEDGGERWLARVHERHVHKAGECVRDRYKELAAQQWQLEELWKRIEENVTVHLQIQKHRERSHEIEKRVVTRYEPLLQEHPSVGATLSQAELYRTHFTTTLYEPAKELLSQATEILEDVLRLRERASTPCDVTDILQVLTVSMQPFTQRLQALQDIYVAVHIFHLLFQKALTWYRKVLKFLPESLQDKAAEEGEKEEASGRMTLQMPREWQDTVHSFLAKHPPPQEQHLARLDAEIPPHVEKRLKVQARSLALRLRLLQRLLFSRRIPVKLLTTVFQWRAEALSNSGLTSTSPTKEKAPHSKNSRQQGPSYFPDTPPPKPARMFDTMRPLSSFSSSDAGDPEHYVNRNRNTSDRPGRSNVKKSGTQRNPGGTRDRSDVGADQPEKNEHDEMSSSEGVMGYIPPPRLSVMIAGATDVTTNGNDNEYDDQPEQMEPAEEERRSDEADERFISLTDGSFRDVREEDEEEDSFDSEHISFRFTDIPTGSESGIEVAENEDPWNSIIDRIKAVSNSNLPSDVKIQCMSHLLSTSHSKASDSLPRPTRENSRFEGDGRGSGTLAGFHLDKPGYEHFQHHIGYVQDPEVRRHKSFAIAGDDGRLFPKRRPEEELTSYSGSELYYRRRGRDVSTSMQIRNPSLFSSNREEKPALAVLKMRHRLARSLMDLDALDYEEDSDGVPATSRRQQNPRVPVRHSRGGMGSALELSTPRFSYGRHREEEDKDSYQERHSKDSAVSSLTRSYAGELDTAHLPLSKQDRRQRQHWEDRSVDEDSGYPISRQEFPRKLNSWRSHGDGLDIVRHQNQHQEQQQHAPRSSGTPGASKSSSRWRQGIVDGDFQLHSPTRSSHHKSNDFIAPSFLKPFRSVDNLHQRESDRPAGGVAGSGSDGHRGVENRGEATDRGSEIPMEGIGYRSPSLERLSDQVDQEYMSQDDVESSLKRSQRILRDAEESFQRRSSQEVDTSPSTSLDSEDLQPSPPTVAKNVDQSKQQEVIKTDMRKQPEGLETETNHGENGAPVEIEIHEAPRHIVNNDSAGDVEEDDAFWEEDSTVASELPERERTVPGGLTADCGGWDADVSNMSDATVNQRN